MNRIFAVTEIMSMTREVTWSTVVCVSASVQTEEIFGVFAALVVRGVGTGGSATGCHVGGCEA